MPADPAATLRANLDVLSIETRQAIESSPDDGFVQVDSTAAHLSASVQTLDGRRVRVHSGRDPVAEADRYVDSALSKGVTPVVVVICPGLGYAIEAIERRAPGTRVIAIEPFPSMARAMLARRDWREELLSGRLTLLLGPEYPGAADAWKLLDIRTPSTEILAHPVLGREFPQETARARLVADHILKGAQANADARRKFAGRYLLNTLKNLPGLVAEGDVASLVDLFPGVPAIVVAAGPSLDDNLQHLRAIEDRALIVAVDTTLRPLRAAGIRPPVVVAVDPSERNGKHLVGIADSAGSWLVTEGSVDPGVLPEFTGRAFGFQVSNHHPWPWLRALGFERGTLRAWGSVVTSAFDLAFQMGCDPIVFVGTDLSYTGGLHYCKSTIHEDASGRSATAESRAQAFAAWMEVHQRPTCKEADIHGATVVSTPDFVQFRNWLVARAQAIRPRRVLNGTGAGILLGEGISQVDLASMSFPQHAGGADAFRARLSAAWSRSAANRGAFAQQFERAMKKAGGDGVPMDTWLAFAGDTASAAQIAGGIDAAWRSIGLTYRTPPLITEQPVGTFWIPGWTIRFAAAATGWPAPAVQWQESRDSGSSWSDIAGATAPTYDHTMTTADLGNQFRAVFTNAFGTGITSAAAITFWTSAVVADFNGDGKPDVLWHSTMTGANVIWYMDGVTLSELGMVESVGNLGWQLVGAGDFEGDGQPDLLWRHTEWGRNIVWYMDGVDRTGHTDLDGETDPAWAIVAVSDFNGDGKPDILWRNVATGANRVWHMDGARRTGVAPVDSEHDLEWTVVGTADFNGDGRPDILWRNVATGANRVWHMDGVTRTGVAELDAEVDTTWAVAGTGDFDGDGQPDILWHNSVTGATVVWYMDGTSRTRVGVLGVVAEPILLVSEQERERIRKTRGY
ncbi:MAG: FG-GAP-like repeat-containing protein [Acidobacteriota bacterium]